MVPLLTMMWGHLQWGEAVRGPGLWAGSALGFLRGVVPVPESHSLPPTSEVLAEKLLCGVRVVPAPLPSGDTPSFLVAPLGCPLYG